MSQFTPPAGPPLDAMPGESAAALHRPQSWSALAIAGFVLSFVGCLGITAALGLVFGIAGIVATRGGRKRGFGLAVAAIPISIVTGALFVGVLYYAMAIGVVFMDRVSAVVAVVGSTPDESAESFATLRAGCTEEFIEKASDENLTAWLVAIREKHGALISPGETPTSPQGAFGYQLHAKFVNGSAPIVVKFSQASGTRMLIDYIDVDGLALGQSP